MSCKFYNFLCLLYTAILPSIGLPVTSWYVKTDDRLIHIMNPVDQPDIVECEEIGLSFQYSDSKVPVVQISTKDATELLRLCGKLDHGNEGKSKRVKRSFMQEVKKWWHSLFIYEGTKWCGMNNYAEHHDDLGVHNMTDACCREHDQCPIYVSRLWASYEYKILNPSVMTRIACDCEKKFYDCLTEAAKQEVIAEKVGKKYFNELDPTCIEVRNVTKDVCVERRWFGLYCNRYNQTEVTEYKTVEINMDFGNGSFPHHQHGDDQH